jgi:putative Mn2+ efflux pump MntP
MTHLLSSFLLSLGANVDAFAVAIAYGVKKLRIGYWSNFLIAFVSAAGTFLSMSVGTTISRYLPNEVANFLGSGVLIAIGLWAIWDTLEREKKRKREKLRRRQVTHSLVASGAHLSEFTDEVMAVNSQPGRSSAELLQDMSYESFLENPEKADADCSGSIDVKESVALALSLTINNLGSGVGAGISGLNIGFTSLLTFAVSVISVVLGYFLGDRFTASMTGIWAGILSGLIIIGLGVYEYFVL